ncbi:helix-turn-helix domain-containing protein [Salegentibacter echinorum]|nr:helix-turn-helix domain-containing protein [Salegentibacter echinorum]
MEQTKVTQVFGITPEELKASIVNDVRAELSQLASNFQAPDPEEYITRQEAAEILKVSIITLSDWNKKGILNPYRLGTLVRYKRSELDKALIQINQNKK